MRLFGFNVPNAARCLFVLGLFAGNAYLAQAAGPETAGWYSGDMHVHRSCGGAPISVSSIYNAMVARDLAVVSLLADSGNGEVQDPTTDLPKVNGGDDPISTPGRIVHWDAEWHWDATYTQYPHQALGGHLVTLGLTNATQVWEEYTFPIFERVRQQGGIAGFAHFQYLDNQIPQTLSCCIPIEYPVEVALGAADFISQDVAGSDSAMQAYYRLLNCGFRPGFAGGSDYPCVASIGDVLTYVRVDGTLTYRKWIDGIKAGRTVVSRNAHNEFLDFKVNTTAGPGDEIQLSAGGGSLPVTIEWRANQNLTGNIELVHNGEVVATLAASVSSGSPRTLSTTVNFTKSGWLAARRMSGRGHELQTGAIFVKVNNAPIRASVDDANFYVQWMDNLLTKTSPGGPWNSFFPNNLAAAQARYQDAKAVYQQIAAEAAAQLPISITTAALPNGAVGAAYNNSLQALGGATPYTWSLSSGTLPGGLTLNSGTGAITGTPTNTGTFSFTVQVADAGNPAQIATRDLSITISTTLEHTIWPNTTVPGTTVPATVDVGPESPIELGVKFRSDVAGTIRGIRFYKSTGNIGTHVGNLWSSTGTLLARATFTSETASGWQQVNFATPVTIAANTVYVASYHCLNGHYSQSVDYFLNAGVDNPPLHALRDGVSGANSVYRYNATTIFPNQGWRSANYWVDVVFVPGPTPTLNSIAVTPVNTTNAVGTTRQFTATGTYSDGSTQNITSQAGWTSSVPAVATINSAGLGTAVAAGATTISATLSGISGSTTWWVTVSPLAISTTSLPNGTLNLSYSATLAASGGTAPRTWSLASGALPPGLALNPSTGAITGTPTAGGTFNFRAQITDSSTPAQVAARDLSITIDTAQPVTIWPSTALPATADVGPESAVELGVKFRSDVAGTIRGIRFYKSTANGGTHIGNLWTTNGTRLATATFSNETASGWQQVNFATPVSIASNTVYVASYHCPGGHYAQNVDYFLNVGVDNPPLHALRDGVSGFNGVYRYNATSIFPNQGWRSANYWVDVVFMGGPPPTLTSIAVTPVNPTNAAGTTRQFTATGTYSDGSTQNLTTQVGWTSSVPAVATINSAGLASAVSAGSSVISATLSGVSGSTTLQVQPPPLAITTTTLPNGTVNNFYSNALAATGGVAPRTWSIASGGLHPGLSLDPNTGAITGTPTVTGTSNFTARVTDSSNPAQTATRALSISITATLTSIAVTPANTSIVSGASQQFTATATYSDGSTLNVTAQAGWTSSVPAVATINSAGLASAVSAGNTVISATLSGISGNTTLTVQPPPLAITTSSLPNGTLSFAYNATLTASGGTTPRTWSLAGGALPPGLSLTASNGAITGTATTAGTFNFTARVTDSGSPAQIATRDLSITIEAAQPVTIWPSTALPATADVGAEPAVELGVKFRSDVGGTIRGIRFYKSTANTGTHIGNLWSSAGTLLASATFTNETGSGWQQVNFASPVSITANTTYVASYHCQNGHYAQNVDYFLSTGVDNPPLHALRDGVSGVNGVYRYNATSVFPNQGWRSANYWVDVVFVAAPPPPLTSIAVTPANPTNSTGTTRQFTATGTYSDGSTQNITTQVGWTSSAPAVATINSAGLASAIAAGNSTISATLSGITGSTILRVEATPLAITTSSLTNGTLNVAYSATLAASGGTTPYTWSLASGALPPGLSLNANSGAITGTPTNTGTFNFTARVTDSSAPAQSVTRALSIFIDAVQPVTIWPASAVPGTLDVGPESAVELGVKFRSDVAGTIRGIRFYKSTANTGTHVGSLWSSTGTLLASATFTSETASGWQQVNFASPVQITANTVYVASYHCPNGHYSQNADYFLNTGVDNPPLHALRDGVSGANGLYRYNPTSIFPTQAWRSANYWVDVVFVAGPPPTLNSLAVTPVSATNLAGSTRQFTATGTYSDGSTQNLTTQVGWTSSVPTVATINSAGLASAVAAGVSTISARLSNVTGSATLTVQPAPLSITTTSLVNGTVNTPYNATLAANGGATPYSWSLASGGLPPGLTLNPNGTITGTPTAGGTYPFTARVTDSSSPAQSVTRNLSLGIETAQPVTIWPSTAVPGTLDVGPESAVELGVKFRSDVAGTIKGIRFYKSTANTGTHLGNLWSSTGTLLGSATFTSETASGWQQVNFATPVSITANTVYVASYHCQTGHYSQDAGYFASAGVDNPPLHALRDGVSGANGLYRYTAASAFPNQAWQSANYWVDVVFVPAPPPPLVSIAVTPVNPTNAVGTTRQFTATATYSDGSTGNITTQVGWTSSVPAVATINSAGMASAVSEGTTTISATLASVTGSTTLRVQATPLAITTVSLPNARPNTVYSAALSASGGTAVPYTWTLAGGELPPGLTLNAGSGTISGTPTADGSYSFTARVTDSGSPAQSVVKDFALHVDVTIWPGTATPGTLDIGPDSPVQLGVKFRSDLAGAIRGIRFYKSAANTGTHVGNLWSEQGALLRSATFTSETASGWQQVNFATPVVIGANTVYVASYHTTTGHYSEDQFYFTSTGVDTPPLHALRNGVSGANGVFAYGASNVFPNLAYNQANFWVDVAFQVLPPGVASASPSDGETFVSTNVAVKVTFNQVMNGATINSTNITLRDGANALVPATVTYSVAAQVATLTPTAPLAPAATYTATVRGGPGGVTDTLGNEIAADYVWSFRTISADPYLGGPGGSILVMTNAANPFSQYYAEILLAEGLNQFALRDLSLLTPLTLAEYDVVILGPATLTTVQVTTLSDWVTAGGNLIAFRPDKKLAGLLGLTDAGSTLSEGYILVNTVSGPGVGIVGQTIQFHGTADRYTLAGASSVATLYSTSSNATVNPAVTLRDVGANGGQAAAFTFDLARSVVLTRQGNPAWAGQERDGILPLRSTDLFYGPASNDPQPNWNDFAKIAIPQADEQQRLLANMMIVMNGDQKLLPRFWYFPHGHKAVVVMTGDDHANNGTTPRFDQYIAYSSPTGITDDWETVRGSSYIWTNTPIADAIAAAYNSAGFEIALHVNSGCGNYTAATLNNFFTQQLNQFKINFPSLPVPTTLRMHCIAHSGYTILPEACVTYGIRMETSYYYFPSNWVANRVGMWTGSGMPMRYATDQGKVLDVFQAATQMTDESGQAYPFTSDLLLDRALGPLGYYGAFVANMHTDVNPFPQSDAIVQSAQSRGVPVITARQLLTWVDARNASSFKNVTWNGLTQTFAVETNPAARGLIAMVPIPDGYAVSELRFNGNPVAFSTVTMKGLNYAQFSAAAGNYQITFVASP